MGTNNRLSGYSYDAAGNMLSYGGVSYTWDAESRMKSGAGVTYTYDGDGRRVKKSNGKLYWYGMSGLDALLETDLAGNNPDEYILFGGKRVARWQSSGTVNYYFADHLGSSRVVTSATGAILDDSDFYPFGGERVVTSSSGNHYKFTGKERDAESGLDYLGARYHAPQLGRFASSDPGPLREQDPQSLNRYSYVRNNPLRFIDETGEYWVDTVTIGGKTFFRGVRETSPGGSVLGHFGPWAKIFDRKWRMDRGDSNQANVFGFVKFDVDQTNGIGEPESYFITSAVRLDQEVFTAFANEFNLAETDHGGITTILLRDRQQAQDLADFHTAFRYEKEVRTLEQKLAKTTDQKKREKIQKQIEQRKNSRQYKKFGTRVKKHVDKLETRK